jgi:hypothetical protein
MSDAGASLTIDFLAFRPWNLTTASFRLVAAKREGSSPNRPAAWAFDF